MDTKNNTILITGGGSGIGRGLAGAFHKLGNQVVISGRRTNVLDEVTAANPGMKSLALDIEDPAGVKAFAAKIIAGFPMLNAVIHNAGIQRMENLKELKDVSDSEAMVATNVLGPIRLNAALLPHLVKQPKATVMTVSSGLAFVPLTASPTYSDLLGSYGLADRWHRLAVPAGSPLIEQSVAQLKPLWDRFGAVLVGVEKHPQITYTP